MCCIYLRIGYSLRQIYTSALPFLLPLLYNYILNRTNTFHVCVAAPPLHKLSGTYIHMYLQYMYIVQINHVFCEKAGNLCVFT